MESWVEAAKTVGIAAVLLFALSYALWKVTIWVGNMVILPVMNRHLKFLDDLTQDFREQTNAVKSTMAEVALLTVKMGEVRELIVRTDSVQMHTGSVQIQSARKEPPNV